MLRGFIVLVVYLGSLIAILLLSFGSLDWPMGWASLGIYIAISLANFFLVDPELVRERSRLGEGVQKRDMLLASVSFLFLFPVTLAIAGIDVGRLGWSPPLPLWLRFLALLLFTLGNALGRWAMAVNRFFSKKLTNWAAASIISTPGMSGRPGMCPRAQNGSSPMSR